jgi:hypothetical protein
MTHYVTRARVWIEDHRFEAEYPGLPDIHVSGPRHVDTGLIDGKGNAIYRTQAPVGFGRDDE